MTLYDPEYKTWLTELKAKIRSVQLKAAIAVNSALIEFYWELGKMIEERHTGYGSQFLDVLSKDLKSEFPEMSSLSVRNLKYARQFYSPRWGGTSVEMGIELRMAAPAGRHLNVATHGFTTLLTHQ